jgi:hypothetical protein
LSKKAKPAGTPGAHPDQILLSSARFGALYVGNTRSSGRFDPAKLRMFTEYRAVSREEWQDHLTGVMGMGVVPIRDDDTCTWAAIDIDNHEAQEEDLPINVVSEKIALHKLPLIACRSKSGGIHCYLFLEAPQPAGRVRIIMNTWATLLGYPGCEIFPKQARLVNGKDGNRTLGNWINLPYMGGDDTNRYAVVGSRKLSLLEFLDAAEKSRVTDHQLRALSIAEHPDAPPCVQQMFVRGVASGYRNEAMYNIVVYLKKANPDAYEAKATSANTSVFDKPLPRAEMQRTIASAGRPDCAYRCNEEPIRSLCDRETCVTRKFGITSGDLERLDTVDSLPTFTDLVKYIADPVRWEIKISGTPILNIATEELLDWRAMRRLIAERLTKIVPLIKNQEWDRILQPLMAAARIMETPDDASVSGVIRSRLREFAAKTDLSSRGEDVETRKDLLRGLPVVQVAEGERCVVFRGADFINYLKRTRSEELKGVNLWFAVKKAGAFDCRMRVGGEHNIQVWALPVREVLRDHEKLKATEFRSDL